MNNFDTIFPAESASIIYSLTEKYGLKEKNDALLEELKTIATGSKNKNEFDEKLSELPSKKIAKMVKERGEGTLTRKDFAEKLKRNLGLEASVAKKLADELETQIISFVKKIPLSAEEMEEQTVQKTVNAETAGETKKRRPLPQKTQGAETIQEEPSDEMPGKPDDYRENIE
jgi:hypothetical protein